MSDCFSCKVPLVPANAKYCSECGIRQPHPQQDRSSKLCVRCKHQIPVKAAYCANCGKCQPELKDSISSQKLCINCNVQLPLDAASCIKCSKPQVALCVICNGPVKLGAQKCSFCVTPHEYEKEIDNDKIEATQLIPNL